VQRSALAFPVELGVWMVPATPPLDRSQSHAPTSAVGNTTQAGADAEAGSLADAHPLRANETPNQRHRTGEGMIRQSRGVEARLRDITCRGAECEA
jgi:hypothetical protein